MSLIHLGIKTDASLGQSIIKVKPLVAKLKELGFKSAGIANDGNLFDAIEFYKECKKNEINPIIGCEFDIVSKKLHVCKCTVIAKNSAGFAKLSRLVTAANHPDMFDNGPKLNLDILLEAKGDLIVICKEMRDLFITYGDDFYIGIDNNYSRECKNALNKFAKTHDIKAVAFNTPVYLTPDDALAHEYFLATSAKCTISDTSVLDGGRRPKLLDGLHHLTVVEELVYPPQYIDATQEIADKCDLEIRLDQMRLPTYKNDQGKTSLEMLKIELRKAWKVKKIKELDEEKYLKRLNKELKDIEAASIADYFLMVQDLVNWARSQDIKVGYGRGSAAGSLVSWLLDIQFANPIEFGLIWERFYNLGRGLSLPDIDMDFSQLDRPLVVDYLNEKYGADSVAHTITFNTLGTKAAILSALKAHGVPIQEIFRITKMVPHKASSIDEAVEESEELAEEANKRSHVFDIAKKMENVKSHKGIHASAIMISDNNLGDQIPMAFEGRKKELVTGFDMYAMDDLGYLKLDVLGLRNLDILKDIEEQINE